MDDQHNTLPSSSDVKNVLPDVVHSQPIPAVEAGCGEPLDTRGGGDDPASPAPPAGPGSPRDVPPDDSEPESISEHIPSKLDYSLSTSDNLLKSHDTQHVPDEPPCHDEDKNNSLNIPQSTASDQPSVPDPSPSASWPTDANPVSDVHHISAESPVCLAESSEASKEDSASKSSSLTLQLSEHGSEKNSEYIDSLNEDRSNPQSNDSLERDPSIERDESLNRDSSSGSEEIIKLDIRGSGIPRFPFQTEKIIFGSVPEGSTFIDQDTEPIPVFKNLLSPFLVGAGDSINFSELFSAKEPVKDSCNEKTPVQSPEHSFEQKDLLVEELTVDESKEKEDDSSLPEQPKSPVRMETPVREETGDFNTMETDYKTICEEHHTKLMHLEGAITQRDQLIEDLTVSLQRAVEDQATLRTDNQLLTNEVQALQHMLCEHSQSEHDTIKAQLSDLVKYESMLKDDSTKYYSAFLSSGSSAKSSIGERDKDQEEVTVNYSRSKSSDSEEYEGFETKLSATIGQFDEFIEENLRNKLREKVLEVVGAEVGRRRGVTDLAELQARHEREMENLRTYFEKKCSDMERSYSDSVYRGRCSADSAPQRSRSAEPLSFTDDYQLELPPRPARHREAELEELKTQHAAAMSELRDRHDETVRALEEQIVQLKAHLQSTEQPETSMPVYQQDIDLELEKTRLAPQTVEEVKQEIILQLQEQIQVLLSDPDAELSSWPLELVALRDKIHGDRARDKELSSVREDLAGEDKWKQKRNLSFDQNRQILEVTKERDEFKLVAVTLQRAVAQLLAYCACAENELNQTVLAQLLQPVLPSSVAPPCPPLDGSLQARRVHFAPDLGPLLAELDEDDLVGYLQQQRDLSLEIKLELENSLRRLRHEARELLALSAGGRHQLSVTQSEHSMLELECSELNITGLVEEMDARRGCDHCRQHRKSLEEATAESLQREKLLRADLEAAMMKIAQLMTDRHGDDLIAEGYGLAQQLSHPLSLPARPSPRTPPCPPEELSPRGKLWGDIEQLQREKEDLEQQLESANRQLRSTRKFVEEQALERESERDEFASRLAELTNENAALTQRLQNNARILNEMHCLKLTQCNCREHDAHVEIETITSPLSLTYWLPKVEQLEAQTREMNQIINEMENKKSSTEEELKATNEKISILRDIIATLENQLEQKTAHETEILEQLEEMRRTIDERDSKMRALVGELESLRCEREDNSNVTCDKCCEGSQDVSELMDTVKEQAQWLQQKLQARCGRLEQVHEVCSAPPSDSEPASATQVPSPAPLPQPLPELQPVFTALEALTRAEDMALRRVADLEMQRALLKDVAQEVRAERDVLQARMSEQALKISSLAARLELQRHNAEALAHDATSQLSVQLHDSLAEVQRLKEELDTKDKQLARLRQSAGERDASEKDDSTHGDSCNTKDKITILERELSSAQSRLAQLTSVVQGLETDREVLTRRLKDAHRVIAEKEAQVDELMALKLDDDDMQKSEQKSEVIEGKTSARTLSDIVSISDFDEQDLQMRRAELRQNTSLNAPYVTETRDKTANRTLPPDVQRANMSSLNIDFTDHFELGHFTPRADSLPLQFTSTQTKDSIKNFKRNINETTIFGTADRFGDSVKHSTAVNIPDNCSMYPNRDVNDSKGHSVDPKKIDFSLEPSQDNKTNDDNEFTSLRELGIVLDIKQENFPDILSQLKHEIKKSKSELDVCKTELKYAEEQLCEFPALKEEVEELKGLLENTMATMETDKKFYENQLDQFSTNKKNMEQRLAELSQEVNDKSKDLHLLKEDILRRENMILELAKEKRNLTNKMTELEVKIDELQSRNTALEKFEFENHQLREKVAELQKLQQLVSEKNQQIDSLNQHLDRLDDLQRNLNDKTEEFESLKEAFEEKSNELFQMQDTVEALNRDLASVHEENNKLNLSNKELKLKLTKLEKEQENQSLRLKSHESELERVNSLNTELTSKIEELKHLTDKLKDKETEIEILNEDINSYHEEIASLKEQLKMVSRSPSPKSKNEEERSRDRQASNDKKQLVKIRKQISLLQHELDFNKKELNDKAFELAKARLDVTELKSTLSQESKLLAERDQENRRLEEAERTLQREVEALTREKQGLGEQLELVMCRIREESNIDELKQKLQEKTEQCMVLERELIDMRDKLERMRTPPHEDSCALVVSGTRSPTAELERALRDQLDYSRRLDVDIMEQVLSASSDNEEIPRLMLHSSKSSSSIESSSSERAHRLRSENDKLQLQVTHLEMQVTHLETRLRDKDALITELNRIRDKLVSDWQAAKLRYEAERDNSGRLQLLLDSQKETCDSLQKQDSSMINILKKRLESSMATELELQQQVQHYRARLATYEAQSPPASPAAQHADTIERLRGETSVLKSRLDVERSRRGELQAALETLSAQAQRENNGKSEQINELRQELAEIRRLKHEAGLELVRAQELLHIQAGTIRELERKLSAAGKQRPIDDALTEIEEHKSSLTREISSLKKCLLESAASERSDTVAQLRAEKQALQETVNRLQNQAQLDARPSEDKEQAIRYLHGRCLRLESCRKALVWQKRYLQRVVAGYTQLEARLQLPTRAGTGQGRHRFRCIATVVIIVLRMGFLVRRRLAARALSANCLLRAPTARRDVTQTPCSEYGPTPPARPAPLRRALHNDLRRHQLLSPLGDLPRFNPNSPRDDPFILNTPRSEAPSYLSKVDLVSRCLNQAMDTSRDVS